MSKSLYFLTLIVCFWSGVAVASDFSDCSVREKTILRSAEVEAKARLGVILDEIELTFLGDLNDYLNRRYLPEARDVVECVSEKMGNLVFHCGVTRIPCDKAAAHVIPIPGFMNDVYYCGNTPETVSADRNVSLLVHEVAHLCLSSSEELSAIRPWYQGPQTYEKWVQYGFSIPHLDLVPLDQEATRRAGYGELHRWTFDTSRKFPWAPLSSLVREVRQGNGPALEYMLNVLGIPVDEAERNGMTALMAAAWSGNAELTRVLVDAGASANVQDEQGWTAVMAAVIGSRVEILEVLLSTGPDLGLENRDGDTAYELALSHGDSEILAKLKTYMGK